MRRHADFYAARKAQNNRRVGVSPCQEVKFRKPTISIRFMVKSEESDSIESYVTSKGLSVMGREEPITFEIKLTISGTKGRFELASRNVSYQAW
jgi:hypothetical protein